MDKVSQSTADRQTTAQFIEKLREKNPEITNQVLRKVTSDVLDLVDEIVAAHGFLTLFRRSFKLKVKPPHMGRNPKDGSKIQIPEVRAVVYRKRLAM